MKFQIIKLEKDVNIYGEPCLNATVKIGNKTLGMSQNSDETKWFCDSLFNNGLPVFVHGVGSRCCMKDAALGELEKALNERKGKLES
jgi:hypothetical protein